MSKLELQDWLLGNPGFLRQYRALVAHSVAAQFPRLVRNSDQPTAHNWSYLLLCASLLAQSDDGASQDAALRIAQATLEQLELPSNLKDAAAVVLDSLSNTPSIDLATQRELLDVGIEDRLPFPLLQDWTRRSFENTVVLSNNVSLRVNRFQKAFWESADTSDWISVSAPTSAGKSFIVSRWLSEFLRTNPGSVVAYVVPTRALIQQVSSDLAKLFREESLQNVSISSMPMRKAVRGGMTNVLVLTQERFHMVLTEGVEALMVDLLIVDEAHKIGDGYRGVLLQQSIETAVSVNKRCKVVFASPMIENPEVLLEDAPSDVSKHHVSREDTMVSQNLLWASQSPGKPELWDIDLLLNREPIRLGRIKLPASPSPQSKRLPFVAYSLGSERGGNIVYVNGAADAEKTAKQLYDLVGSEADVSDDSEIQELVELIHRTVHRRYALAVVITRGIAFHYGNMPLTIRNTVERLFRANRIKYLVCTSTLIEGVNMPCQSIFMRGPKKGRGKTMSPNDFWNLAGRAGRLGTEFQGNVVCVDAQSADVWEGNPPTGRGRFKIKRAVDEVMSSTDELIKFIKEDTPRGEAAKNQNLEYAFSYLVTAGILYGGVSKVPWADRFPSEFMQNLSSAVESATASLSIPSEIILRNPGISPIAMEQLISYFKDRADRRGEPIDGLLPVRPESDDAMVQYAKVLNRLNRHLGDAFGRGGRVNQIALLTVDWMRGYPLARIIANRERYYGNDDLAGLIRDSMKDVEEFARYKVPKYLACYIDLLRFYLGNVQRGDLAAELFDVHILLEYGVSHQTQLSLMDLGLSRTAAIALSEYITDNSLDEIGVRKWLLESDWLTNDLPALTKREIREVLDQISQTDPGSSQPQLPL